MNVVFTVDYTGPLTGGRYYPQGDVVSLPAETAILLYRAGVVTLENPPPVLVNKPSKEDPFQVVVSVAEVPPLIETGAVAVDPLRVAPLPTTAPVVVSDPAEPAPLDTDTPAEAEPPAVDAGVSVAPKPARKRAPKRAAKKAAK